MTGAPMGSVGATWREMTEADLPAVDALAGEIHVSYPEDAIVFKERLKLYAAGCFMLVHPDGRPAGYAITHPWLFKMPPELNVLLGAMPEAPSTYYIHDIALAADARGGGAASAIVRRVIEHARGVRVANVSLVAVNGSAGFWARHGFEILSGDAAIDSKLKSYDDEARFMVKPL